MKKIIKVTLVTFFLALFIGLAILYGLATGDTKLPSDLTRSAQNANDIYERLTSNAEAINWELTRIALEPDIIHIPTSSINSQNWLDNFLHRPTCQIPCWENITPNITEIDVATRIVSEISGAKIVILDLIPHPVSYTKELVWQFDTADAGGRVFTNQGGIVLQIDLWTDNGKTLYISDAINAFGDPDAIITGQDIPGEYYYILSYRHEGMLLSTTATSNKEEPVDITPTIRINRVTLYSPDNPDFTLRAYAFNINDIPWGGYKTYDFTNK